MERKPTSSARKMSPSERRAKKLADEADAIASKIIADRAKKTDPEDGEPITPPFAIDASGPSQLKEQDIATWTAASGWTPVEFLTHLYRNPWQKTQNRIAAAKAVLEYNHRKMPEKLEIAGRGISLDMAALSKLSDKELATLEKILEKAQEGAAS